MTVHVAVTYTSGGLPIRDAKKYNLGVQVAGPWVQSEILDETGDDVVSFTCAEPCVWRVQVPAGNAAGVYYWPIDASTSDAVSSTTALWLDPGQSEVVFTPAGWAISVDETAPA